VWQGAPAISGCEFTENDAWWGSGGGISWQTAYQPPAISDCVFRDNHSHQTGAGIASADVEFTVERCQFISNTVDEYGYGAGIDCFLDVVCEVVDCTFVDNSGVDLGGGLHVWFGAVCTVRRCTFVGNTATTGGSGIAVENADVTITNTILAFGGVEPVYCGQDASVIISCSDVYGNAGGDWVGCIASQAPAQGNLSADPLFCGESNPDAPYSLRADSPCAPNQYPCLQIGAWPVGCAATPAFDPVPAAGPRLRAIAPNPFNPQTTITFALARAEQARIAVHDPSGRRLVVLVDRELAAGTHTVSWNGRDEAGRALPSGSYLVRLETTSGEAVRKAVLVR
jgi:predicted outer membrane repeat protein